MEGLYTVDSVESNDHFRRMALDHEIERSRGLIADYESHMAHYRQKIEDAQYALGKLDERLRK